MKPIMLKISNEDFNINYEIDFNNYLQPIELPKSDQRLPKISSELNELEVALKNNNDRIDEINKELKLLTNEADIVDYSVAEIQ